MEQLKETMRDVKDAVKDTFSGPQSPAKTALIILSDGAEESEVVITADVLRRGGIQVTLAGFSGDSAVKCDQGVMIKPDMSLDHAADMISNKPFDIIIVPGGEKGSQNMKESDLVGRLLRQQEMQGGFIGAICGGPTALDAHNVGIGKCITAHKSKLDELQKEGKHRVCTMGTCVDGNIITTQGPGTAFNFGLTVVEKLMGPEVVPGLKDKLALPA